MSAGLDINALYLILCDHSVSDAGQVASQSGYNEWSAATQHEGLLCFLLIAH